MACSNVFDAFKVATESLPDDLYRVATFDNVWLNLIKRGVYKKGTGLTQSVFTVGNSMPVDDEPSWSSITLANGSNSGACAPSFTDAYFGFDESTYAPERFGLRGPIVCKDDLYFDHNASQFLNSYMQELGKHAGKVISNRLEVLYRQFVPKYVALPAFTKTVQTGITGLSAATSQLTQQMLDRVAVNLIEDRATMPDSNGFVQTGPLGPIFSLYLGMEASQAILTNNSDLRQDIRDAMPSELMKRLGATTVIKNFRHIVNLTPPRFSHDGTDFVRVPTYANSSGTKGTVSDLNPNWVSTSTAPYEGAYVLNDQVFTEELIEPETNPGENVNFDPSSYFGEWKFVTGPDAHEGNTCSDPLHKRGRHFAEYMHAAKPGANLKAGAFIIFKRCPTTDFTAVTCS